MRFAWHYLLRIVEYRDHAAALLAERIRE